jgi:hypothetical protein
MLLDALQYLPTASDIAVAIQTKRAVGMNCRTPYHRRCHHIVSNKYLKVYMESHAERLRALFLRLAHRLTEKLLKATGMRED